MTQCLAFVGLPSAYFLPSGNAVQAAGIRVYWITALTSDAARLRAAGVPREQILEVFARRDVSSESADIAELASLERDEAAPRINDVVLMDRMLRRVPTADARRYCATASRRVAAFLSDRGIDLVVSGRDTALQLVTMLVCRRDKRTWVVPTRTRLPRERYGFQTQHHVSKYLCLRPVTSADRAAAREYLEEFRSRNLLPAIRASAGSWRDVLARLPQHARLLALAVADATRDYGDRMSRYTVPDLAKMYLRRRLSLLGLRWSRPYERPAGRPYVLYTLHTQPESSIDVSGSPFVDQPALIGQIARAVPATHDLYVKVHPSDIDGKTPGFYRLLARIPGVRIIAPDVPSRPLLQGASLVCTVTGTVGFEAGLLGIPAITFAPVYYNRLPSVHYCPNVAELSHVVQRLLASAPATNEDDAIVEFMAELFADSVPGDFNRISAPLTDDDLRALVDVYRVMLARATARASTGSREIASRATAIAP